MISLKQITLHYLVDYKSNVKSFIPTGTTLFATIHKIYFFTHETPEGSIMKSSGPSGPCELSRTLQNNTHRTKQSYQYSVCKVNRQKQMTIKVERLPHSLGAAREEVAIHREVRKKRRTGISYMKGGRE